MKKRFNRMQIKNKETYVALLTGFLILILMIVMAFQSNSLYTKMNRDHHDRLAISLATTISEAIGKVAFSGQYQTRLLVEDLSKSNSDVATISVESLDRQIIANSDPTRNGSLLTDREWNENQQCISQKKSMVFIQDIDKKKVKVILVPFRGGFDNEIQGVVRLVFDETNMFEIQKNIFSQILLLIFIITIILMLSVYLFSRYFGKKVNYLASHLEGLLNNAPLGILVHDKNGIISLASKKMTDFFSNSENSTVITDLAGSDFDINSRYKLQDTLSNSESLQSFDIELKIVQDGKVRYWQISKFPISSTKNNSSVTCILFSNVSERRIAENSLRESEKRFRAIFEAMPFPVVVSRLSDGKYIEVNEAQAIMLGLPREEIIGKSAIEIGADPETSDKHRKQLLEAGKLDAAIIEMPKANGSSFWFQYSARLAELDGEQVAITGLVDITDLKLAQESILESEKRFRALIEFSPIPIIVAMHGKILLVNNAFRKLVLLKPDESLAERTILDFIAPEERERVTGYMINRIKGLTTPDMYEATGLRTDGSRFQYEISVSTVNLTEGTATLAFVQDISERKQTEELLKVRERRFAQLLQNSFDTIVILDREGIQRYVSESAERIHGHSNEELVNINVIDKMIHPDDKRNVQEAFQRIVETGKGSVQYRHKRKEGGWVYLEAIGSNQLNNPDIEGIVVNVRDITERKLAEEKIRQNEQQFKALFDLAPYACVISDMENRYILVNEVFCKTLGKNVSEILGHTPDELGYIMNIDSKNSFIEEFTRAGSVQLLEATIFYTQTGQKYDILLSSKLIEFNGKPAQLVVLVDITSRKIAEEALRESEERIREIGNNLPNGMIYQIVIPTEGTRRFTYLSSGVKTLHGFSAEDGMADAQLLYQQVHPDDAERLIHDEHIALIELTVFDTEARFIMPSGEVRWRRLISRPRVLNENDIIADGIEIDITDRKRVEEELEFSEIRLRANLENTPNVAVQWYDRDGKIIYWNNASEIIYGFTVREAIGKTLDQLIYTPEQSEEFLEIIREIERTGIKYGPFEAPIKRRDGSVGWIMATTFAFPLELGSIGIVCMDVDITERKIAEQELINYKDNLEIIVKKRTEELGLANQALLASNEALIDKNETILQKNEELNLTLQNLKETQLKLIQSEKMASLGTLTAGVAHEINNPLNYLMGAQLALRNYFDDYGTADRVKTDFLMNSILVGVERISGIVKGLNQFSRSNEQFNEDCDIHTIINNCLVIVNNKIKYTIKVEKEFFAEPIIVKGNVGKLHQVFINILNNSIQAISDEGVISIRTFRTNEWVTIEITDTGIGIEEKNIPKITEPFFTTKAPGEGTGLGLSITYAIIQDHKGYLDFQSEINNGTKVIIKLPKE